MCLSRAPAPPVGPLCHVHGQQGCSWGLPCIFPREPPSICPRSLSRVSVSCFRAQALWDLRTARV